MLFRSDRKSTRLNSSHLVISYAVFCLKKKKKKKTHNYHLIRQTSHHGNSTATRSGCCQLVRLFCRGAARLWLVFLFFFFFFFFNYPAPPEIYPFSPPGPFPI